MIRGVICPRCGEKYLGVLGENRSAFDIKGHMTCPYCKSKLKFPKRLAGPLPYLFFFAYFAPMIYTTTMIVDHVPIIWLYIGLAIVLLGAHWVLKYFFDIEGGYIKMVLDED